MFVSQGGLVSAKGVLWEGTTAEWGQTTVSGLPLVGLWATYAELYKRQLWVAVVVNKRAGLVARLPLKTYLRDVDGRTEARDHPYAQLLRKPSRRLDKVMFWTWVTSTWDIYGEAFLAKVRDPGGRPVELIPLHPTAMHRELDQTWTYRTGRVEVRGIPDLDLVQFSTYNPDSLIRGMSKLEPLRDTLANEDAARRSTSAFWRNGARPSVVLAMDGNLSQPAADRLSLRWQNLAGGADNTGKTIVLEEGLKPVPMQITNDEAQYIETRKLNREEVVAAYDMPPPAVQILDHATFSNITEQFRSVYRDTAAPVLNYFEAVLETQLRGSRRPGFSDPDFGDEVYAEFLLDEVLRGDFESRLKAYKEADFMTVAEKRTRENLPFIDGTDVILVNTASAPLDALVDGLPVLDPTAARAVLRILGRHATPSEVDTKHLPPAAIKALSASIALGESMEQLRQRIKNLREDTL